MISNVMLDPAMISLLAVVGATIWFAVATRRGLSGAVRTVRTTTFLCGALIGSLGAAHTLAVTGRAIFRRGPAFEYDFRLYALVLLGVLLIGGGVRLVAAAWRLSQDDLLGWNRALVTTALLFALNCPLMPIQGFAAGFSMLLGLNLFVLLATRRQFVAPSRIQPLTKSGLTREPLNSAS